ncbi:MAG: hypothetical protein EA383_13045 [Spirochaetaceae bacterium]|nr:MAG: hypothetical protein EA383_13045 [Spirochaetaceae bacterium]
MKKFGIAHTDIVHMFETQILTSLIRWFAVFGLIALVPSMIAAYVNALWVVLVVDIAVYLLLLILALTDRFSHKTRAALVIIGTAAVGLVVLFFTGQEGAGFMWLMASVVFTAGFASSRTTYITVSALAILTVGYAIAVTTGLTESDLNGPTVVVIGANVLVVITASTHVVTQLVSRLRTLTNHQTRLLGQLSDELQQNMEIQRSLRRTLDDKRAGLHELDHRVRNNIQVMMSLLNLAEHDHSDTAFRKLRLRMEPMATVQQLVDPTGDATHTDVAALIFRTFQKVHAVFSTRRCDFQWLRGEKPREVFLTADRSVQLGLACTEAFTNSLLHAAPATDLIVQAQVSVHDGALQILLMDNGSAVSADFDYLEHQGLSLLQASVEQCGGTVEPHAEPGFRHLIRIPLTDADEIRAL